MTQIREVIVWNGEKWSLTRELEIPILVGEVYQVRWYTLEEIAVLANQSQSPNFWGYWLAYSQRLSLT